MYEFEDYYIGQKSTLTEKFTRENVLKFASLTGDINPLHIDENYAFNTHFKKCIVHGTYVTSLIGTVLGTKLPGLGTILVKQEQQFLKPVFIDDTISLSLEIIDIEVKKQIIVLDIICINQHEEIVITGMAIAKKMY